MNEEIAKQKTKIDTVMLSGLKAPNPDNIEDITRVMGDPPRDISDKGLRTLKNKRNILLLLSCASVSALVYACAVLYWESRSNLWWFLGLVVVLPLYFYSLYLIISRYKLHSASYLKVCELFRDGKMHVGQVNTMSFFHHNDYDNLYLQKDSRYSKAFVRVDFNYVIDGKTYGASQLLRLKTCKNIQINDIVAIVYHPERLSEAMIVPIAQSEFKTTFLPLDYGEDFHMPNFGK